MNFETENPELETLISTLARSEEHHALRHFACWCARQINPVSWDNLRLLTTAEQHLRGELAWDDLRAKDKKLNGSLSAALLIGVNKCNDPAAAVRLVYGATHNPYPAVGASEAARWMRAYHILSGARYGVSNYLIERKVESVSRLQVITLNIIANWCRLRREKGGRIDESSRS